MRGFQPQNFADGGLVQGAKRLFGMDEEHNARIAAYRAQQAQEKAQQQAAQQQAQQAAQPAAPAVSDYAGMSAMKRREKAAGLDYADGGMVRGPGTGTSDDVPDKVREGTYIMPADSTQAVGADKLEGMGARGFNPGGDKVPVNLSDGEFKIPPEQVHAIGVQALNQVKEATHQPVRGFAPKARPEEPRQFFANGGLVEDESTKRPSSFGDAAAAAQNAGVTQVGGLANNGGADAARFAQVPAPIGTQPNRTPDQAPQPPGAPAATPPLAAPPAAQPAPATAPLGQTHSAGSRSGVQMVADGLDGGARAFFDSFQKAPEPSPAPAAPRGMPSYKTDVQRGGGNVPAVDIAAPPSATAPAAAPGPGEVTKAGNSYSGTNVSGDISINGQAPRNGGQVSAQNLAAADALAGRQQQESMSRVTARGFAPAGGGPGSGPVEPGSFTGGFSGVIGMDPRKAQQERERSQLMSALSAPIEGARGLTSSQRNGALQLMSQEQQAVQAQERNATALQQARMQGDVQRETTGMREAGDIVRANARNAIDSRRVSLDEQVRGFDVRQGQRQEKLYERYDAAKTPEERAAVAQQIRDLSGKQAESPWKLQVTPTTKNADGSTSEGSIVRYNMQTGQVERVDAGSKALAMDQNQQAIAIRDNQSLSREQKVEALRKLGYQG